MKKPIILLLLLSIFFTNCSINRQLQKAYLKKPELFASYCSKFFPSDGTSVETIIEYIPGDTTFLPSDTMYINCDTLKGKQPVKCPPNKLIRDTIYKQKTIKVFDSAKAFLLNYQKDSAFNIAEKEKQKQQVLQNEVNKFEEKVKDKNGQIAKLIATIMAMITICVLYFVIKIK